MHNQITSDRRKAINAVARWTVVAAAAIGTPAFAATYNFIPGAGTTPNASVPGMSGDWSTGGNWATGSSGTAPGTTGTVPGSTDQASSSMGATTNVTTVVGAINELRFANIASPTNVNNIGGIQYTANGTATLTIASSGSLTISGTSTNGNCTIGNANGAIGTLILNGGSLSTSSTGTGESLGGLASVVIGNTASSATATGPVGNFFMNSGLVTVGNNFINGYGATVAATTLGYATGNTTQIGGAINVAGAVIVGAKGRGTYVMSGGQLNQNGTNANGAAAGRDAFYVGQSDTTTAGNAQGGQGTFTQSGTAAVNIANGLYIANQSNTTGLYTISGGNLTVAGNISVGAGTGAGVGTAGAVSATNNKGKFQVTGNSATSITGNHMTADTANSTLEFDIGSSAGTTPILISAVTSPVAGFSDGIVALTSSTTVDINPISTFAPAPGDIYTLITAAGFTNGTTTVPTLVATGGFAGSTLSIVDNGNSTFSLIDTVPAVPEPVSASLLALPAILLGARRRRTSTVR